MKPKALLKLKPKPTSDSSSGKQQIVLPRENDILLGRGGASIHNHANVRYRSMVREYKKEYQTYTRREKTNLAERLVKEWQTSQTPPGRFLEKDEATSRWYIIDEKSARKKTSQLLREGAPKIRRQLKQDSDKEKQKMWNNRNGSNVNNNNNTMAASPSSVLVTPPQTSKTNILKPSALSKASRSTSASTVPQPPDAAARAVTPNVAVPKGKGHDVSYKNNYYPPCSSPPPASYRQYAPTLMMTPTTITSPRNHANASNYSGMISPRYATSPYDHNSNTLEHNHGHYWRPLSPNYYSHPGSPYHPSGSHNRSGGMAHNSPFRSPLCTAPIQPLNVAVAMSPMAVATSSKKKGSKRETTKNPSIKDKKQEVAEEDGIPAPPPESSPNGGEDDQHDELAPLPTPPPMTKRSTTLTRHASGSGASSPESVLELDLLLESEINHFQPSWDCGSEILEAECHELSDLVDDEDFDGSHADDDDNSPSTSFKPFFPITTTVSPYTIPTKSTTTKSVDATTQTPTSYTSPVKNEKGNLVVSTNTSSPKKKKVDPIPFSVAVLENTDANISNLDNSMFHFLDVGASFSFDSLSPCNSSTVADILDELDRDMELEIMGGGSPMAMPTASVM